MNAWIWGLGRWDELYSAGGWIAEDGRRLDRSGGEERPMPLAAGQSDLRVVVREDLVVTGGEGRGRAAERLWWQALDPRASYVLRRCGLRCRRARARSRRGSAGREEGRAVSKRRLWRWSRRNELG